MEFSSRWTPNWALRSRHEACGALGEMAFQARDVLRPQLRLQQGLHLREHQDEPVLTECGDRLVLIGIEDARCCIDNALGDLVDVVARITVLRRRCALCRGVEGLPEPLHLNTRVVEVVLARDVRSRCFQQPM